MKRNPLFALTLFTLIVSGCGKDQATTGSRSANQISRTPIEDQVCSTVSSEWNKAVDNCLNDLSSGEVQAFRRSLQSLSQKSVVFYPEILNMSFMQNRYLFLNPTRVECIQSTLCHPEKL
jgi:hypothetical protein